MKYILTEKQLSSFIRKYLNSLELDVTWNRDGSIWVKDGEGNAIFHYYIETYKTYLMADSHICSTVEGMFGLDGLSARVEVLLWFEDKFDRRVDEINLWD
jgi:hypothetical protein